MLPSTVQPVEGAMHRQWRIRRQVSPHPDAQQWWDQAYQLLLSWMQPSQDNDRAPQLPIQTQEEGDDD